MQKLNQIVYQITSQERVSSDLGNSAAILRTNVNTGFPLYYFKQNGYFDIDGVRLNIDGPMQFHGDEQQIPQTMLRLSRNQAAHSRNCPKVSQVEFTGKTSKAHLINEGLEISSVQLCQFNQTGSGACVYLSNMRPMPAADTQENRTYSTNSGHIFQSCSFYTASTEIPCIIIEGCSTDIVFRDCWFSGNAPSVHVKDSPDEPNRSNTPANIRFIDCLVESPKAREIRVDGVQLAQISFDGCSSGRFYCTWN